MSSSPDASAPQTSQPPAGARRLVAIALGLVVSATFLLLLLRRVDLSQVWSELSRVHAGRLALSVLTLFIGFFGHAARSVALFAPVSELGWYRLFKSVLLAFAGNNVLPLRAGELLRVHYLARHGQLPHSSCLALVAVERLMDLLVLVALFFSLLPLVSIDLPPTGAVAGIAAVVGLGLLALLAIARWPRAFVRLASGLTRWLGARVAHFVQRKASLFVGGTSSLRSTRALLGAMGGTLAYWALAVVSSGMTLWAFDLSLPWTAPMVVLVFASFAVTLPSSPGFVGTYHYFVALSLRVMGVPAARAASFAFLVHAAGVLPYTLISVLLLIPDALRGDLVPATATATSSPAPSASSDSDVSASP